MATTNKTSLITTQKKELKENK